MIIAIDFDGVIVKEEYPAIGPEIPGAVDAMKKLHADGHTLILYTCRAGAHMFQAMRWLNDRGLFPCFKYFNCNDPTRIKEYGDDSRKISADIYVDDKAVSSLAILDELMKAGR